MKRKTYMQPTTQVVILQQQSPLLDTSSEGDLGGKQKPKEEDWD